MIRYNEPETIIFDYLQEIQSITFSKFRKLANLTKYKAETILVNLIVLNIIKIDFTENQVLYKLGK